MSLETDYPEIYKEWVAAGGITSNFRSHLLALGAIPVTRTDLLSLIDEADSKLKQIRMVAQRPF